MKNYNFFYAKEPITCGSNYDSAVIGGPVTASLWLQPAVIVHNLSLPIQATKLAKISYPLLSIEAMNHHWYSIIVGCKNNWQ
jgi:hypothetical protein